MQLLKIYDFLYYKKILAVAPPILLFNSATLGCILGCISLQLIILILFYYIIPKINSIQEDYSKTINWLLYCYGSIT